MIGLLGGIGAGKTAIAQHFARLGCGVVDSDQMARRALETPSVQRILRQMCGPEVVRPDGTIDRRVLAEQVFSDPGKMEKLTSVVHPLVAGMRRRQMKMFAADAKIKAIVWDSPLLLENHLERFCDALVFVQTLASKRLARVRQRQGWSRAQWAQREKLQMPLDKKKEMADYIVDNNGEAVTSVHQVRRVFSQILAQQAAGPVEPNKAPVQALG